MVSVESYGQDRYKRILGEVLLGDTNINLEMVSVGLAEDYRGRAPKTIEHGAILAGGGGGQGHWPECLVFG